MCTCQYILFLLLLILISKHNPLLMSPSIMVFFFFNFFFLHKQKQNKKDLGDFYHLVNHVGFSVFRYLVTCVYILESLWCLYLLYVLISIKGWNFDLPVQVYLNLTISILGTFFFSFFFYFFFFLSFFSFFLFPFFFFFFHFSYLWSIFFMK